MTNEELIQRLREGLSCYGERCLSCPDRKHCVTHYEHEAADAIESLQLFVDLYQHLLDEKQRILKEVINKYPRWVPISERKPEEKGYYLTLVANTEKPTSVKDYYISTWDGERFYVGMFAAVTHWMPLPKVPKEES